MFKAADVVILVCNQTVLDLTNYFELGTSCSRFDMGKCVIDNINLNRNVIKIHQYHDPPQQDLSSQFMIYPHLSTLFFEELLQIPRVSEKFSTVFSYTVNVLLIHYIATRLVCM